VTIIGTLGLRDGLQVVPWFDSMNGPGFVAYLEACVLPRMHSGDTLVLDNCSIHKVAGVERALASVGAHVLYLPPYSPEFNPIEEAWSKVKHALRRIGAVGLEALGEAVTAAVAMVTSSDVVAWVRHAGY
jgi:transposase